MSERLEACPFCGKTDRVSVFPGLRRDEVRIFHVGCRSCKTYMGDFYNREEATEAWNKRKPRDGLKNCPLCYEAVKEEERREQIRQLNIELSYLTGRLETAERGLKALDKE